MLTEKELGGGIRGRAGRTSAAEYSGSLHCGFTMSVSGTMCVRELVCVWMCNFHSKWVCLFLSELAKVFVCLWVCFCVCGCPQFIFASMFRCVYVQTYADLQHMCCPCICICVRDFVWTSVFLAWVERKPRWHQRGERWEAGAKDGFLVDGHSHHHCSPPWS